MSAAAVFVALAGVTMLGLTLGLVTVAASGGAAPASAAVPTCVTTGAIDGLSADAAQNARTVVAVSEAKAGSAGAVIAVMVADTESGLRILGNSAVGSETVPTQGVGSNRDSLGLFQQRASWGTVAQRLDPQTSTTLFIDRLIGNSGWQEQEPWVAAQHVQISAWNGTPSAGNDESSVVGGNYEPRLGLAQRLVAQVDADASKLTCGALTGGLPASTAPGSHGLPDSYAIPSTATAAETRVVSYAIAQLDKPYVFGADGPTAFDCSGLVLAAWREAGVALPHDAAEQSQFGTPASANELVPGDLVFVPGDDGTLAAPGHVGIYIGDGLVLNAADEQDGIRVQTYDNFLEVGHGLADLRHLR